ncbi:lipopolysaccharide heptosyltransferase II [Propionispora hippei DSM 15287]|uniref:lipopolysaccharide heptosyltransferase II n=2 Tax=Propionispora TaxID=112902 RepID=A0A1M6K3V3_9FIRM|nr:lipopolysaccharide heptosyltransferase II [Propionispora hippei DSM 15287]
MSQSYKHILVFCLRKIGDAIIATSVPYLLKQAYPDAKITMMVKPLTKEIVTNHPMIDEVMLYNYSHKASLREIRQIATEIKQRDFDLCIVADNKPRSAMLAWLAGVPKRIGFEKIEFRNMYLKLFYTDIIKIDYDAQQTLQAKNHEIFINRFTGKYDVAKMMLPASTEENNAKADMLLAQAVKEQGKEHQKHLNIALCIQSGAATKDWPIERFAATIKRIAAKYNAVFYVIGSPADIAAAERLKTMLSFPLSILCGKTNLVELSCVLRKTDFFLTIDTGSTHMAAAIGIPMVAIYGGTSPQKWGPYCEDAITLAPDYPCHPCDGTKIKCSSPKCLLTISVDEAVAACEKVLKITETPTFELNHKKRTMTKHPHS